MKASWSKSRIEKLRWMSVLYKTARVASLIRITLTKLVPKKMLRKNYFSGMYRRGIGNNSWLEFIYLH